MILNTTRMMRDYFAANFNALLAEIPTDATVDLPLEPIAVFGCALNPGEEWARNGEPERIPAFVFDRGDGQVSLEGETHTNVYRDLMDGTGIVVVGKLYVSSDDSPKAEADVMRYLRAAALCIARWMDGDPAAKLRNKVRVILCKDIAYGPVDGEAIGGYTLAGGFAATFKVRDELPA